MIGCGHFRAFHLRFLQSCIEPRWISHNQDLSLLCLWSAIHHRERHSMTAHEQRHNRHTRDSLIAKGRFTRSTRISQADVKCVQRGYMHSHIVCERFESTSHGSWLRCKRMFAILGVSRVVRNLRRRIALLWQRSTSVSEVRFCVVHSNVRATGCDTALR
jgi:hypothetical protein